MAFINDSAYDAFVNYIKTNATRLDICSTEPTTYAQATSTYSLGNKTGLSLTGPTDGAVSGRRATVPAITTGSVTATGTAAYWALTDGASILVATGPLTATQAVTNGNNFSLGSFDLTDLDATT